MCNFFVAVINVHAFSAVHFRFIVFRPFVGEVLIGTLTSSSNEGLHGNIVIHLYFHY